MHEETKWELTVEGEVLTSEELDAIAEQLAMLFEMEAGEEVRR